MILDDPHGRGPVRAIALHGWFGDRTGFDAMLAGIDPERFSIAVPDLRGYGAARDEPGPYDMRTVVADTIRLADRLGWDRFALIGHSMGGKAALLTAVTVPDRVTRLVGISPVWAAPAPFDEGTLGMFRAAAGDVAVRQAIIDYSTGHLLPEHWAATLASRSAATSSREAFAGYLESWAMDDFASAAIAVRNPVLVIAGAHDQGVPLAWLRETWLARLPNCDLSVIADAGHYPLDEVPLRVARLVGDFIGEVEDTA